MLNIKNIEAEISKNAKEYFNTNIEAKFNPSLDLNLGDFYSDYCIVLAKEYKKSVSEIYKIISKDLSLKDYDILLIGDYINIKLKKFIINSFDIIKPNVKTNNVEIKSVVIFIPLLKTYTKPLFYRLSFLGFLNKILFEKLGVKVEFFLGSKDYKANDLGSDTLSFSRLLEKVYDDLDARKDILEKIYDLDKLYNIELFLIHIGPSTFYQRSLPKALFKTTKARTHFALKFHSKDWGEVYKEDIDEMEDFIKSLNKNQNKSQNKNENKNENITALNALMYMLSTNKDFKEINYYDATINTQENFIYFLNSTLNRINKFFKGDASKEKDVLYEFSKDDKLRNIMLRGYTLNSVLCDTVRHGRVGDFLSYFDELLRDVNYVLNTPSFRSKLVNGEISSKTSFVFNYIKVVFQDFLR
ncbi:MAG: hypothetical protein ACOX3T_04545 [Bdellovibrionota bacterium]